jgi:AcrR family transcriptional regulator
MNAVTLRTSAVAADPRIARSEATIQAALLGLLAAGRPFGSLTVSEVADAAGVTRKTFYARFGSLERVVYRLVADLFTSIVDDIDDAMLRLPRREPAVAMLVFRAYETHRDVLGPLIAQCPSGLFLPPVSAVAGRLLDRLLAVNDAPDLDEVRRDYLIAVVASVVHGILTVWVRRGFSEPPEALAGLTDALLAEGIERLLVEGAGAE